MRLQVKSLDTGLTCVGCSELDLGNRRRMPWAEPYHIPASNFAESEPIIGNGHHAIHQPGEVSVPHESAA